jgi:DNA polymerase-1
MGEIWGFDIETNQLSAFQGEPAILSAVLWEENAVKAHLLDHPLDTVTTDEQLEDRVQDLQDVLGDPNETIVGHNLVLFDLVWWEQLTGLRVRAKLFDTRVAQTLIDENAPNSLADAACRYLGYCEKEEMKDKRAILEEVDPDEVLQYNIQDSQWSGQLWLPMTNELADLGMLALFDSYMQEYRTLADMTLAGTAVDEAWVKRSILKLRREEKELRDSVRDMTGAADFNPGSPKQVGRVLYEDLKFPILKHTKSGQPSTSAQTLRELRTKMVGYPEGRALLDDLIRLREVTKMQGTYLHPYLGKHRGNDGRIHPTVYIGREGFVRTHRGYGAVRCRLCPGRAASGGLHCQGAGDAQGLSQGTRHSYRHAG